MNSLVEKLSNTDTDVLVQGNPAMMKTEIQLPHIEQNRKGINSYNIYKFLIKVFIIYILPSLLLVLLGVVEMGIFKSTCEFETSSELCFWHIYMFLLFFYYLFPFPLVIPTAIFLILEIVRKIIKKYKPSQKLIKSVQSSDL